MAELADAQRSGRCLSDQVQVRILLGASVNNLERFTKNRNLGKLTFIEVPIFYFHVEKRRSVKMADLLLCRLG